MQVLFSTHPLTELEGENGRSHPNNILHFKLYYKMHTIKVLEYELSHPHFSLEREQDATHKISYPRGQTSFQSFLQFLTVLAKPDVN